MNSPLKATDRFQGYSYLLPGNSSSDGWLFGLKIQFLPDFLMDHTLINQEFENRILEHWRRWTQFVSGLWHENENASYLLGFDFNPNQGRINTFLLGKWCPCRQAALRSQEYANLLLDDLERMLQTFGFEPIRMLSQELERLQKESFSKATSLTCFEVCQEESAVPLEEDSNHSASTAYSNPSKQQSSQEDIQIPREFMIPSRYGPLIYGIRPWWGPGSTFLVPFNILTAQSHSVSVRVLLKPTSLREAEKSLLAEVAREAESLAQLQTKASPFTDTRTNPSKNRTDPQLRWESRLYAANLRRLSHPFLTSILCFSENAAACQQVASALASTLREEKSYEPPSGESEFISSGARAIHHSNPQAGIEACKDLNFDSLLNSESTYLVSNPALKRLRYLVDARGAISAFRFPVSIRGGVPGLAVKQRPPDFHPGPLTSKIPANSINLGKFHIGGNAFVPVKALTQHVLVTGFTGSGKTNTVLSLLHQLWHLPQPLEQEEWRGPNGGGIPFLVIESAKHEYRGLLGVQSFKGHDNLRVYTLGNETCAPFRLNPFQLLPGVRLEAHISRLLACFQAALPPIGPLPSILAEAIELIYKNKGWSLTAVGPKPGTEDGKLFPTMDDLFDVIEGVVEGRKYAGEVRSNVMAATKGRLQILRMGSLGYMFGAERNNDLDTLFKQPVILELNDLNLDDKALVMMFLLTLLREYREQNPSRSLQHVTVVEEAHNVLAKAESKGDVDGGGADTKAKSVEAFCNILAEVRALGEGIIIADQSPNKLAPDAMRNTNVQIAHQLRDGNDREAIANAMIMDEEQRDFIGKLERGNAAVFYTGLQKATFIQVPQYYPSKNDKGSPEDLQKKFPGYGFRDDDNQVSDHELSKYMDSLTRKYRKPTLPLSSCEHCESQCRYRKDVINLMNDEELHTEFQRVYLLSTRPSEEREGIDLIAETVKVCKVASSLIDNATSVDAGWCFLAHMWAIRKPEDAYLPKHIYTALKARFNT